MAIEIKLIGFGDDRPARFGGGDRIRVELATPASADALLAAAGIDDATGLIVMDADRVIPLDEWARAQIEDGTRVTLLSAFEGG